ncbi:hypothetical protein CLD22_28240, partial [Rubrivivax gelatinosus]|nr:hypothetical protein [Rubrivivax gelatinosus]
PLLADELQGTRDCKAHPWVAYAMERLPVAVAERLGRLTGDYPVAFEVARACGFASTVLVPVHGPLGYTRRGLLCLGSATPGYFHDDAAFAALRLQARTVAFELHEWWIEQANQDVLALAGLDEEDRALLMDLEAGLTSKQIAPKLALSACAVDSRVRRLNRRLGVTRRRGAVKLAVHAGLLDSPSSSSPSSALSSPSSSSASSSSPSQARIAADSAAGSNESKASTGNSRRDMPTADT